MTIKDARKLKKGNAVIQLFTKELVLYKHEVKLSEQDRVDFMLDNGIALEIKDGGGISAPSAEVKSIILLTTKLTHKKLPSIINGKPVTVIILENWV